MLPYQIDSETKFCLLSDIMGDCLVMPISQGKNNFELKRNKDNTIKQYKKQVDGVASTREIVVMIYLGNMTDFTSVQIWNDIVYPEFERQNLAKLANNGTLPIEDNKAQNRPTMVNPIANEDKFLLCPNCAKIGISDLVVKGDICHCVNCDSPIVKLADIRELIILSSLTINGLKWLNLGDSPLYAYNPPNNEELPKLGEFWDSVEAIPFG